MRIYQIELPDALIWEKLCKCYIPNPEQQRHVQILLTHLQTHFSYNGKLCLHRKTRIDATNKQGTTSYSLVERELRYTLQSKQVTKVQK